VEYDLRPTEPQLRVADTEGSYTAVSLTALDNQIDEMRRQMEAAAKELDFIRAAKLRDRMYDLIRVRTEKER
jgi:excinuclease UvrABC helicase subunit UvrB